MIIFVNFIFVWIEMEISLVVIISSYGFFISFFDNFLDFFNNNSFLSLIFDKLT